MDALIVVESMFGNTRKVADAVMLGLASGLPATCDVSIVDVSQAPQRLEPDVGLLVVGAPTHAFGMSRPSTRQSASDQGAEGGTKSGVREWLKTFEPPRGQPIATFDTRIKKRGVPGSAAKSVMHKLARKGGVAVDETNSFWVTSTDGPLLDGEIDRAQMWGNSLATRLPADPDAARKPG